MSDKDLKQRINIKFCVKIGKSASEMLALCMYSHLRLVICSPNI